MAPGSEQDEVQVALNRPPYKIRTNDESFKALYKASCNCGRVKYQISREKPLDAKFCHCNTCQVLHGAPFQWAAIFKKEDISFTHGHSDLVWYDSAEKIVRHKLPCKVSCGYCRSPIMDEGRNMILLFPTLVEFRGERERERFNPTSHIFYASRTVDIRDGLPKWTGLDGQSDLIEDSPPEAVEEWRKKVEERENEE